MKSNYGRVLAVFMLLAAIAGVLALKSRRPETPAPPVTREAAAPAQPDTPVTVAQNTKPPVHKMTQPTDQERKTASAPSPEAHPPKPLNTTAPAVSLPKAKPAPAKAQALPRLLELGADKCVPCKMMQPVLAELRQEYTGKLQVDFIDVWKDPSAGEPYGVRAIPMQIFFDADGKEIYRHTGFYPKEEILATFREYGVAL